MKAKEFLKSKGITKATCYTDSGKTYYVDGLSELMEEYAKQQSIQFGRELLERTEIINENGVKNWFGDEQKWGTQEIYDQFKNENLF